MFKAQLVSGASSGVVTVKRSANATHSGTDEAPFETATLDDTLIFSVAANKKYLVRGFVLIDDPDNYQGWQGDFAVPAGAVIAGKASWTGNNDSQQFYNTGSYDRMEAYSEIGSRLQYVCEFWFILTTSATAGTVTLRHYNVGGSPTLGDITILKGSYLEYEEVG